MIIEILTLTALFLVLYHHIGYPVILRMIAKGDGKQSSTRARSKQVKEYSLSYPQHASLPTITLLLPAYNEEHYIAEKIRNIAFLDYPKDKLNIIVAADGCSDNTVDIAIKTSCEEICCGLRLKVIDFPENRGKVAILNAIVPTIKTDLLALSDVSSLISIDALKVVAERFHDQSVGALNGNYRLMQPGSEGEALYWQYQRNIKIGEQKLGSVIGAHGAFYVIRPELFRVLPNDCVNDDFVIPMNVIAAGKRVVYDARLNAVELEKSTEAQNWNRRLRIGFGNAQQVMLLKQLFSPKYGGVAFTFFSGKGLRLAMPFLMLLCLVGSWLCAANLVFALLAVAQSTVYIVALMAHLFPKLTSGKFLRAIHYLVSGHLANFIGSLRYFTGNSLKTWS